MLQKVEAMIVFVQDLARCTSFYRDTIGLEVKDTTPDSVGFDLGGQYFLLIEGSAAARMVSEKPLEKMAGGPRGFLAASVENIDATYETLKAKGMTFLRPPADQSWGLRTAYFADPEGNLWEINQSI